MNSICLPLKTCETNSNISFSKSKGVEESLCHRIKNAYQNSIQEFVEFLQKHEYFVASMILGTLLMEPCQAIKAGILYPTGWKRDFNFYSLNPSTLTKEQSGKQPILLIHGNYHNQSAWISLAKALKSSNLGRPVYTINTPNGKVTDADFKIVERKIEQIKSQYRHLGVENIQIDLIGHSRGGSIASQLIRSEDIGKIIKIGNVLNDWEIHLIGDDRMDRIYEITGKQDILERKPSLLTPSHHETINSGHLGIVNSSKTHNRVIEWLR